MYVDIKTTCYSFKIEEPAVQEIRLLLHPHQIIMIFKETQTIINIFMLSSELWSIYETFHIYHFTFLCYLIHSLLVASSSKRRTTFWMIDGLSVWLLMPIRILTVCTRPCSSFEASTIFPSGHWAWGPSCWMMTISPTLRFHFILSHFCLLFKFARFSLRQRDQNCSTMYCTRLQRLRA